MINNNCLSFIIESSKLFANRCLNFCPADTFLIKSETNLPVNIPAQQLRSIRVEHFQATMLFPVELREVCYVCGIILYPYATSNVASCDTGTGNMAA